LKNKNPLFYLILTRKRDGVEKYVREMEEKDMKHALQLYKVYEVIPFWREWEKVGLRKRNRTFAPL